MNSKQLIWILCLAILSLSACKKSEVKPQEDFQLDLENIMEYYMVIKHHKYSYSHAVVHYVKFNKPGIYSDHYRDQYHHGVSGIIAIKDNVIELFMGETPIFRFKYQDGKLTSLLENPNVVEAKLIKKKYKNPFAGKTFVGKYYKQNGTVLHESFFYQFNDDVSKVSAGLTYPTVLRTSDRTSQEDIAFISSFSSNFKITERFIYDGEKMYVTYDENGLNEIYYGEFVEKK